MIKDLTKQFIQEEDGAGLLEYLILAALAAVVAVFLFPGLRSVLKDWFGSMIDNVNGALTPGKAGNPSSADPGASDGTGNW